MSRFLNVGIIQVPLSEDTVENLKFIEEKTEALMSSYHRPELIVGVEYIGSHTPVYIPGPLTDYFGKIAKKHGIYFIPGSICEKSDDLEGDLIYNSAPVFNPSGELIANYRKMAPWKPVEEMVVPGRNYVVFDIPEKDTKIGLQICYDLNYPEISRNETLMGAEVLVKITMDPQEVYQLNRNIHFTRALENQAYLVSANGTGFFGGIHLYGKSMVVSPEGQLLWEAGQEPTIVTVTLDLDLVKRSREYGTIFFDHYMQHLREFAFPMPYAENISEAPLFKTLRRAPRTVADYEKDVNEVGACEIGNTGEAIIDIEKYEKRLSKFLEDRKG